MPQARTTDYRLRFQVAALAFGLGLTALLVAVHWGQVLLPDSRVAMSSEQELGLGAGAADLAVDITDESRALMPNVFVGWVAESGQAVNIAEPGYFPVEVPSYAVEVETSLKGGASGSVVVAVAPGEPAEDEAAPPLEIGQRYLFAASARQGAESFVINEGLGNVRVADDAAAAELIRRFESLIAEADPYPQVAQAADPCEAITAEPALRLAERRGRAGSNLRVTATNVVEPEVGIWWRTPRNRVGIGSVRADCTMTEVIEVPRDANPGIYDVIIMDARGMEARAEFQVTD